MKKYNEKEMVKLSREQVFNLNKFAGEKTPQMHMLPGSLPFWIHFNNLETLELSYMNETGLKNFREDMEEIKKEGVQFLYRIVHPESAEKAVPLCTNFIKKETNEEILFFEQKIRYSSSKDYINHLSFAMVNKILNTLLVVTLPSGIMENFIKNRIFPDNKVFYKFYDRYMELTKREKEILSLIVKGKTNKEIGEILMVSLFTVRAHRRNILNKLDTNNLADLTKIAVYFNLIS